MPNPSTGLMPDDQYDYAPEQCPTCKGRGTVNPLTAPNRPDFFCVGTTQCPDCDGSGEFDR